MMDGYHGGMTGTKAATDTTQWGDRHGEQVELPATVDGMRTCVDVAVGGGQCYGRIPSMHMQGLGDSVQEVGL